MFNPGKLKIKIAALENGTYALGVVNEENTFLTTNHNSQAVIQLG